ncbi:MAG: phosphatidate cytidylyltransferase [Kiritimatiellia bacterium]
MLKYRVLTGGSFLALVAALYVWAPVWAVGIFLLILSLLAVLEMVDLVKAAGFPALKWTCLGLTLLWMLSTYAAETGSGPLAALRHFMPALSLWMVCLGCLFRSDQRQSLDKLTGSFLTLAYIAGLIPYILLIMLLGQGGEDGRSLLLYGILVIKFTDMGAYFVGSAIGKHKMIPIISPAKTWEGVVGGVLVAMGVSSLFMWIYGYELSGYRFSVLDGLLLGFGLAVLGVLGDLVESMLKRSAGIKDSGNWLRGMGGILDVLDSLLFALPLLYLYVHLGWMGR